jgi:hypothetical protein
MHVYMYKINFIFWGYFMIYSSETIGRAEAHRQSEEIALGIQTT